MVLAHLVLTLLVAHHPGSIQLIPLRSYLALFLTTRQSRSSVRVLCLSCRVLGGRSQTRASWLTLTLCPPFETFGLPRGSGNLLFPPCLNGGTKGKKRLKELLFNFVVQSPKRNLSRSLLSNLASHLKFKIDAGQVSLLSVYQNVLTKLAALDLADAQGAKVRSRVKWAEDGETSSRYFLNLEKRRGAADWISAMKSPDGSVLTSIGDICDSWTEFYSSLFTACTIDPTAQANLLSNVSASLTFEQSALCEGHLTLDEVRAALLGMARNKSSGSDRLPMEFYLSFWDVPG